MNNLRIPILTFVITFVLGVFPAQATPIYYNIAQTSQNGNTSKFSFKYDPVTLALSSVSDIKINDVNGRINAPLEFTQVISTDPSIGSAFLIFLFNNSTTSFEEALVYDGSVSVFNQAGISLVDARQNLVEETWSLNAGDPVGLGKITVNGEPLGFINEAPIASAVSEPYTFVLLAIGLLCMGVARKKDLSVFWG